MLRRLSVALIALVGFIGLIAVTTSQAEAQRGHGWHRGGHVHVHRGWSGHRHFGHRHWGHRHYGFRPYRHYGFRPFYRPRIYGFYRGPSCWRWRPVATPYGVQMRRVWVCGPRYGFPRYF